MLGFKMHLPSLSNWTQFLARVQRTFGLGATQWIATSGGNHTWLPDHDGVHMCCKLTQLTLPVWQQQPTTLQRRAYAMHH